MFGKPLTSLLDLEIQFANSFTFFVLVDIYAKTETGATVLQNAQMGLQIEQWLELAQGRFHVGSTVFS